MTRSKFDQELSKCSPKRELAIGLYRMLADQVDWDPEPAEGPDPGEGYRFIDKEVDQPQDGDEYWNRSSKKWYSRDGHNEPFSKTNVYRRRVETELSACPFCGCPHSTAKYGWERRRKHDG